MMNLNIFKKRTDQYLGYHVELEGDKKVLKIEGVESAAYFVPLVRFVAIRCSVKEMSVSTVKRSLCGTLSFIYFAFKNTYVFEHVRVFRKTLRTCFSGRMNTLKAHLYTGKAASQVQPEAQI